MTGPGPTGPVISPYTWFTQCVDKDDYYGTVSFGVDAGLATLGKDACDYLLGRKLVCLDGPNGTKCAIGTIVHIEPVGYQKPFPTDIDNDFCVNILLFPHRLGEFSGGTKLGNWDKVRKDDIQGVLIDHDPAAMPKPEDPKPDPTPYTVTYLFGVPGGPSPYEPNEDKTERLLEEVKQDAAGIKRTDIPILHAEFEGSRIFAVCTAIKPFLDLATGGPGSGACRAALGWIPFGIGDAICTVIETLIIIALAPFMAAAAAAAWAAAGIHDELFLTGPISRQVSLGDDVIVTGRWTWDGGHSGWNEFHPTFTLQKMVLPESTTAGFPKDEANSFVDAWCGLVAGAPPATGEAASGLVMTPEQQDTADRQRQPEHGWLFHPAIDGCAPDGDDDDEDIPDLH
jgi:hypothetical protein